MQGEQYGALQNKPGDLRSSNTWNNLRNKKQNTAQVTWVRRRGQVACRVTWLKIGDRKRALLSLTRHSHLKIMLRLTNILPITAWMSAKQSKTRLPSYLMGYPFLRHCPTQARGDSNSLWPCDVIWRHRSLLTLDQVIIAWRQAITWADIDKSLMRSCGIYLGTILQKMLKIFILDMRLTISNFRLQPHLLGVNVLNWNRSDRMGFHCHLLSYRYPLNQYCNKTHRVNFPCHHCHTSLIVLRTCVHNDKCKFVRNLIND